MARAPWGGVWEPSTSLIGIVVRVVLIYVALIVLVRVAGKREIGQLGPLDLLAMLILSETVSPALTAQDDSLPAALTAAATLLALTAGMGRLAYRSRRVERWMEGRPVELVRDGELLEDAARKERVTRQELESAMRREGVETLAEVRRAVVEPNGEISVISAPR
jgi:uncharacterized membrane protein YcaP (DUF421 family)